MSLFGLILVQQKSINLNQKSQQNQMITPRTKKQKSFTQPTQESLNLSNKNTMEIRSGYYSTGLVSSGSNKQMERIKPVAKLSINIRKKKVSSPEKADNSPQLRVNPLNYRPNIISKMSSQQHGKILSYGIATYKGARNITNPHFISLNLGNLNSITLCESIDGTTAAKMIKQQFRTQLTNYTQRGQANLESILKEVYNQIQCKVMNLQEEVRDNSGATLTAVVVDKEFVTVANAGSGQVVCVTNSGNFLRLSQSHTTRNKKQMSRVIKNGGKLYQTIVNVPYQQQLQIQGPMRVSPSGLIYTRCLGKTLDYKKQIRNIDFLCNPEQQLNLTWKPQIRYIKTNEVSWIGIFSDSITNNCSFQQIQSCMKMEMSRKSEDYTQHHIAMQVSKKIITKLTKQGIPDAMTSIILFTTPIPQNTLPKKIQTISTKPNPSPNSPNSPSPNNSLNYIGNRRSFVKSVQSSSKNSSLSLSKGQKLSMEKQRKQMRRDFSFSRVG